MHSAAYRFAFADRTALREAEMTLDVARFSAEGLLGAARVERDFAFFVDPAHHALYVEGHTRAAS
jgi:hypothetical protein